MEPSAQQYASAEFGMWLFLATEVLFFGGLVCLDTVYRIGYHSAFVAASHRLDVLLGAINTAVLLTSSLTMVLAVRSAQTNDRRATVRNLLFTIVLGTTFLCIKGYEYHEKFVESLVPGPNFLVRKTDRPRHSSAAGTVALNPDRRCRSRRHRHILLVLLRHDRLARVTHDHRHRIVGVFDHRCGTPHFSNEYFTPVEMSGFYWHFVDIVWVFLFPLLYLIR